MIKYVIRNYSYKEQLLELLVGRSWESGGLGTGPYFSLFIYLWLDFYITAMVSLMQDKYFLKVYPQYKP